MKNSLFNIKLHNKLIAFVSLLVITVVICTTFFISDREQQVLRETVLESVYIKTSSVSRQINHYIYNRSWRNAQLLLQTDMINDPDLVFFYFENMDGIISAASEKSLVGTGFQETAVISHPGDVVFSRKINSRFILGNDAEYSIFDAHLARDSYFRGEIRAKADEHVFYIKKQLVYSGTKLGYLHLAFSKRSLYEKLGILRSTAIIYGAAILSALLLAFFLIIRINIKPLTILTQKLSGFSTDATLDQAVMRLRNLDIDDVPGTTSEINNLKEAFIHMKEMLLNNFQELENHKNNLSQQVGERTEAITRINQSYEAEIAERKEVQEQLTRKNAYMSALHKTTLDIIGHLDQDTLLETVFNRAGMLLDSDHGYLSLYDPEEKYLYLHLACGFFKEKISPDQNISSGFIKKVCDDQKPLLVKNYTKWEHRNFDPKYDNLHSMVGVPLKSGGSFYGIIGFGHFTPIKEMGEDELYLLTRFGELASIAIHNARLHMKLNDQLLEMDRMEKEKNEIYDQLLHAQKMEAIGTLAGGIAHDINNLLMAIQGNASLIQLRMDPADPVQEKTVNIMDLVKSGSDLTRQLLGFARGGTYEASPANINTILKKSSQMFGRTSKNITVHETYQKDLWLSKVNRGQIDQVFLNLFLNATHAINGSGSIFLNTENVILDDSFALPHKITPGRYVKISFRDTGMGIDESIIERIFEPFFTTKELGKSTGLGLASTYGIVKNHQGVITVESTPGEGTTFFIFLPATKLSYEPLADTELRETPRKKSAKEDVQEKTILLIDDEEIIRDIGKSFLDTIGYRNICVESGRKGIDILRKNNEIDLVILDVIMPEMDGKATFIELKKINPDIKVLLSSGYTIEGAAADIMENGCDGFIQKPFIMDELKRKIHMILN